MRTSAKGQLDIDGHIICKTEGTIYYSTDWGWVADPAGYAHNVTNSKATAEIIGDYLRDTPSVFLLSIPRGQDENFRIKE